MNSRNRQQNNNNRNKQIHTLPNKRESDEEIERGRRSWNECGGVNQDIYFRVIDNQIHRLQGRHEDNADCYSIQRGWMCVVGGEGGTHIVINITYPFVPLPPT